MYLGSGFWVPFQTRHFLMFSFLLWELCPAYSGGSPIPLPRKIVTLKKKKFPFHPLRLLRHWKAMDVIWNYTGIAIPTIPCSVIHLTYVHFEIDLISVTQPSPAIQWNGRDTDEQDVSLLFFCTNHNNKAQTWAYIYEQTATIRCESFKAVPWEKYDDGLQTSREGWLWLRRRACRFVLIVHVVFHKIYTLVHISAILYKRPFKKMCFAYSWEIFTRTLHQRITCSFIAWRKNVRKLAGIFLDRRPLVHSYHINYKFMTLCTKWKWQSILNFCSYSKDCMMRKLTTAWLKIPGFRLWMSSHAIRTSHRVLRVATFLADENIRNVRFSNLRTW